MINYILPYKYRRVWLFLNLLFILLFPTVTQAQRSFRVTSVSGYPSNWTPDSVARHYLVAPNIDISDVTFNGRTDTGALSCSHIGYFLPDTGNTYYKPNRLGLDAGLILSTGNVNKLQQYVYNQNENFTSSRDPNCSDIIDPDLQSMSDTTLHDHAVLEFDFVPHSNHFGFTFVFASEEYPDYVCSKFNDVFGFFLTGPKPDGGYYNSENVAVIRDTFANYITTIPITINTINGGHSGSIVNSTAASQAANCDTTHSRYYRSNPYDENLTIMDVINWNLYSIEYNGMTSIITINVPVIACEEYHIKIGIANAKDNHHDSDLLIKMHSFTSDSLVRINHSQSVCNNDLPYYWPCGDSLFTFAEEGVQYYRHGTYETCDTLETLTLHQGFSTLDTITDTACHQYSWYSTPNAWRNYYDEFQYSHYYNSSGTYTSTLQNGNSQHCDSILTLNLTILDHSYSDYYDTIVYNDRPAIFHGNSFYYSQSRNIILAGENALGCDSIIRYHLHIWDNVYTTVRDTICDSEINPTYDWDGTIFTPPLRHTKHTPTQRHTAHLPWRRQHRYTSSHHTLRQQQQCAREHYGKPTGYIQLQWLHLWS